MVSFRGQKKLEPRPDRSPLEVLFKISDEHPTPFICGVHPPPPGWIHSICSLNYTRNNQRLRSVGNNDRRSERFCSSTVIWLLYLSFTWQTGVSTVKTRLIRLPGVDRPKRAWPNCVLCIPFIFSGSSNDCWLHTCDACVITTWRLGLRAPFVARNKIIVESRSQGNACLALKSFIRFGLDGGQQLIAPQNIELNINTQGS